MGESVSVPPTQVVLILPFHRGHSLQSKPQVLQSSGLVLDGCDGSGGAYGAHRDGSGHDPGIGYQLLNVPRDVLVTELGRK